MSGMTWQTQPNTRFSSGTDSRIPSNANSRIQDSHGTRFTIKFSGPSAQVRGMLSGVKYTHQVRSVKVKDDGTKITSAWSSWVHTWAIRGPYGPPATFTATAGDRSVELNWSYVTEAEKYKIAYGHKDSGIFYQDVSNATSVTISGLTNDIPYYFTIQSIERRQGRELISDGFFQYEKRVRQSPLPRRHLPIHQSPHPLTHLCLRLPTRLPQTIHQHQLTHPRQTIHQHRRRRITQTAKPFA